MIGASMAHKGLRALRAFLLLELSRVWDA
jgi:hypothetical protein